MGHLRGMSVHVTPAPGEMSKGSWLDTNVFTDIAFETGCGLLQLEERHVFVTSISGAVYQVSTPRPHQGFVCLAAVKEKTKDYTFWRQFNETTSITPGCPGPCCCYICPLWALSAPCPGRSESGEGVSGQLAFQMSVL